MSSVWTRVAVLKPTYAPQLSAVVVDLAAGGEALEAREDRLVDGRRRAAPRDVVEVAEAHTVSVEGEERHSQADLAVRLAVRVVEGPDVRARVVEGAVQVVGAARELADVDAHHDRSLGVEVLDEPRHLLVEREVRQVLAAAEPGVQVVEEEAVRAAIRDARVGGEGLCDARRVQHVVVAERPRQAGIHEVADADGEHVPKGLVLFRDGRRGRGDGRGDRADGGRGGRGLHGGRRLRRGAQGRGALLRLVHLTAPAGGHLLELGRCDGALALLVVAVGQIEQHLVRGGAGGAGLGGGLVALLEEQAGSGDVPAGERGSALVAELRGGRGRGRRRRRVRGGLLRHRRQGETQGEGEGGGERAASEHRGTGGEP
jgi:hypothetical protein